jgi:hypothetical protein
MPSEQARRVEQDPGRPGGDRAGRGQAEHRRDQSRLRRAPRKDLAFALALVLDELARHLRDLDD